jgi:hypothetical protein
MQPGSLSVPEVQNILWTGGWDSTFQLVRSLVSETREIQPFYLIDESRSSTGMELLTMRRIKHKIRADIPARATALLPVRFIAVSDLLDDEKIAGAFARIRKRTRIGIQYEWLGRFCCQFRVSDLQLCIHQDDRAHVALEAVVEDQGGRNYRVMRRYEGTDEHVLFQYYSFPVFDLTKRDMLAIAKEQGFESIMKLTWFCHAPKDGKPCGTCGPCRYTIEEGFGWRVPYFRRLKGSMVSSIRRLAKERLKTSPLWQARST